MARVTYRPPPGSNPPPPKVPTPSPNRVKAPSNSNISRGANIGAGSRSGYDFSAAWKAFQKYQSAAARGYSSPQIQRLMGQYGVPQSVRQAQPNLRQMPDRMTITPAATYESPREIQARYAAQYQPGAQRTMYQYGVPQSVRQAQPNLRQMPDRMVPIQTYRPPQTRVTYSTPINVSGKSPTMLPDQYFNMQQRVAGSQGLTGNTLPDTLQGQAYRVYDQWTGVPTIGQGGNAGGYSGYDDYGYGGYGGYGGGGGWSGGGGGGTYKEDPPEWYQIMTTWNFG